MPGQQSTLLPAPRRNASPSDQAKNWPISPEAVRAARHTSHACDRCRLKRSKCSGGSRCARCVKDDTDCHYSDRKRDRNRKDLAESTSRVGVLEGYISELAETLKVASSGSGLSPQECRDFLRLLEGDEQHEDKSYPQSSRTGTSETSQDVEQGEIMAMFGLEGPARKDAPYEVVSLGLAEGAAGFIGQISEISWMQRVRDYLIGTPSDDFNVARAAVWHHSEQAPSFSYFMDESNLLSIDEDDVEEHEWPTPETVIFLSEACFHGIHGAFPFVDKASFFDILFRYDRKKRRASWAERRWLALANMVWAVGAKWLQLARLGGFTDSHLMYYARARALGLDHRVLMAHPDVESVQSMGLLSYYLFINGSIARSWTMLGHATRHLTALGLHLDVAPGTLDEKQRHRRARAFYSLYSLEVLLAEVTGRPKFIALEDITSSLDVLGGSSFHTAIKTESPSMDYHPSQVHESWIRYLSSHRDLPQAMTGGDNPWGNLRTIGHDVFPGYFLHRVRLCKISHSISSSLYNGSHRFSWFDIQQETEKLEIELRNWRESMPQELELWNTDPTIYDPRPKIEIAMYYYSVQMILFRPFLANIRITDQSASSRQSCHDSGRSCVLAAAELVNLLPDKVTDYECHQLLPSWALLHYICQAAAVLALELCLDPHHFSQQEIGTVVTCFQKAVVYMRCLSQSSLSAYKASRIFHILGMEIQSKYGYTVTQDMPPYTERPNGWSDADESRLANFFLHDA